jgi:hypothetical protein
MGPQNETLFFYGDNASLCVPKLVAKVDSCHDGNEFNGLRKNRVRLIVRPARKTEGNVKASNSLSCLITLHRQGYTAKENSISWQ